MVGSAKIDGVTVLGVLDRLDRSDASAVQDYNALSFAYFWRDDVEEYSPGRVIVRVQLDRGGPHQLVLRDKWPSVVADPLERSRIITEAMKRGEWMS